MPKRDETPAEIIDTLRKSGWSQEDLDAVPVLRNLQDVVPEPSPRCGYCHRRIFLARSGDWYHEHNSSTSCRPGEGSARRAFPRGERSSA